MFWIEACGRSKLQPEHRAQCCAASGLGDAIEVAAARIKHDPADRGRDEQEIVLLLSDYSFTPPEEIFAKLRRGEKKPNITTECPI